ncbi:hypothetical protein GH714_043375 [Hevea brasiliensis]|uniref:L-ascorbate peroxidase n=1 Tax=Hevea brasiliensis TaxID=3981 RepID=A0A6A6K4M1_HEVBR|nr:hypothetical protein GH714_043375 [Hevea brasiliensis]
MASLTVIHAKASSLLHPSSSISNSNFPLITNGLISQRSNLEPNLSKLALFQPLAMMILVGYDYICAYEGRSKEGGVKGKAAGVLRLVFHDAGTFETVGNSGGMNGSIVFELDRPENAGLKKSLKILEKAKIEVDAKQSVSWADMIAVAGAEAVSVCGGPTIPVILGRLDSAEPDAEGKLPEESLGASSLKQCFQRKGLSTRELVALSGAHTIGSKGFGNPTVFDNSYYKILLEKPWMSSAGMSSMIGLPSDRALVEDDECLRWIKKYADDQDIFFDDFKNAYIKLVNSGARWKSL